MKNSGSPGELSGKRKLRKYAFARCYKRHHEILAIGLPAAATFSPSHRKAARSPFFSKALDGSSEGAGFGMGLG